jgi:hypothetical protein
LVTKVDTGFQHFAHGNGHKNTPKVGSKIQSTDRAQPVKHWARHLVGTDSRMNFG